MSESPEEIKEYLAKVKRTIAESEAAVEQVRLRMRETDRMLEAQGLTREQVAHLSISQEQRRLVNQELKRRGLPELEEDEETPDVFGGYRPPGADVPDTQGDLDNRRERFGAMMRDFRL